MARFDVYRLDDRLVVDVQTDYIIGIGSRLVIPLEQLQRAPKRTPRLNPVLDFETEQYVLMPEAMSTVPIKWLARRVGSLPAHADDITDAIQVLLTGF